jgi:uncharacterized damage-inducible protein DinB
MRFCGAAVLALSSLVAVGQSPSPRTSSPEYAKHFGALGDLSVAVAQAMPVEEYAFRPDPPSMTFGELMTHIAQTNYQFCYGLKDAQAPNMQLPTEKDAIVKSLADSFSYCSGVISGLTDEQLSSVHPSPDGKLSGRESLLAMYIHVAHHRGQAEIYLRDKGIAPPNYKI